MRTIKFRVWDKINKHLYEPINSYLIDISGQIHGVDGENNTVNFELLQFTGFQDKNKKDIYEGDILSHFLLIDEEMQQSFMQVFWCSKVGAWKLDHSYKQDKSSGDLLSDELILEDWEISGNIYQNTELLKTKTK